MAGFEQEAFKKLRNLLKKASAEAIPAAEMAAARVCVSAARAAAPVDTGQLKRSIKIIESKDRSMLSVGKDVGNSRRIFIGPEKKKGYYGFFLEVGHKTAGRNRVNRKASVNTHSQKGSEATSIVPARPWFEPAIRSAEVRAMRAAETALNDELKKLDGK